MNFYLRIFDVIICVVLASWACIDFSTEWIPKILFFFGHAITKHVMKLLTCNKNILRKLILYNVNYAKRSPLNYKRILTQMLLLLRQAFKFLCFVLFFLFFAAICFTLNFPYGILLVTRINRLETESLLCRWAFDALICGLDTNWVPICTDLVQFVTLLIGFFHCRTNYLIRP